MPTLLAAVLSTTTEKKVVLAVVMANKATHKFWLMFVLDF